MLVISRLMCTSTGSPATHVWWTKDNIRVTANGELYEESQTIINATEGTYENRLTIVNKSSTTSGYYTCEVSNTRGNWSMSLYVEGMCHLLCDALCEPCNLPFSMQGYGITI